MPDLRIKQIAEMTGLSTRYWQDRASRGEIPGTRSHTCGRRHIFFIDEDKFNACDLDAPKKGKPRSVPQHRRYFALIRAAFYHWPDGHEFRPQSEEHLRKWLQCKAGYHKVDSIETAGMEPEHAVAVISARCAQAGTHAFFKSAGSRFYIFTSNSVDFDTLPHLQACAVFDDVAEIIESETGVKCDDMIRTAPRVTRRERALEVAS